MTPRPPLRLPVTAAIVAAGVSTIDRAAPPASALEAIAGQVQAAEIAFAKTMADRDLAAFAGVVAEDAVCRGDTLLIGRASVVDAWRASFAKPAPPFFRAPDLRGPWRRNARSSPIPWSQ